MSFNSNLISILQETVASYGTSVAKYSPVRFSGSKSQAEVSVQCKRFQVTRLPKAWTEDTEVISSHTK